MLVIGRNDRGEVAGIDNGSRLLEELPNKVRDLLGIMVDVDLRSEAGREYLEITVPAYPNPIKLMIWNAGQLPPDWTLDQLARRR